MIFFIEEINKNLEGNRGQRSGHATVEGEGPLGGDEAAEDLNRRSLGGALLPYSERVERVTGYDSGGAAASSGDKLSPPAVRKKLRPELHFTLIPPSLSLPL